jgi:pimeloyl-ACP methyl ester carboxylesterase
MSTTLLGSQVTAPTQFVQVGSETYAYRRFGAGPGLPLLFLQHFTGTLDNWDPAVTDPLASGREVILFDNAGVGRSDRFADLQRISQPTLVVNGVLVDPPVASAKLEQRS